MVVSGSHPSALTIAAVDSGGGAGVTTDLKTFSALGVHGACVITALTAQNTRGIQGILLIKPSFVEKQAETVLRDLTVGAAKTGVLYDEETVKTVVRLVDNHNLRVVVDPVFHSGTGRKLATDAAIKAYINSLIPDAVMVTPNVPEASKIGGLKIRNIEDMKKAAWRILDLGVKSLIIKGGHLEGDVVKDLLLYEDKFTLYEKPRVGASCHGGGCCFSAAITAYMASGLEIPQAVENSENYIRKVLEFCMRVGGGRRIVNPLVPLHNEAERSRVREDVKSSLKLLMENRGFLPYLADVGTQIAMSLPFPSSTEHVAAVARRIRMEGGKFKAGDVRFGVSSHMANLVLACHALDDRIRAALNLHYNPALVEMLRKSGLAVSSFDRKYEPRRVKQTEGETLRWGVKHASVKRGRVPDVIYDLGEEGKEPMIRIVGRSAMDVVRKAGQAVKMLDAHRRQR